MILKGLQYNYFETGGRRLKILFSTILTEIQVIQVSHTGNSSFVFSQCIFQPFLCSGITRHIV